MSNEAIVTALAPVLSLCRDLDFSAPDRAEAALEDAVPFASDDVQSLRELCVAGVADDWLCNRGEGDVLYSRVAKPDGDQTCSVDAVLMTGPGPRHRHPNGEVDLCFGFEGDPSFDGRKPGWVVYRADSTHTPTVTGGKMLILYILPGGAIEWVR